MKSQGNTFAAVASQTVTGDPSLAEIRGSGDVMATGSSLPIR